MKEITNEDIEHFIEGRDPMERIVYIDYKYSDKFVTVIYRDEKDQKCSRKEPFYPFCWATKKACLSLCNGNRDEIKHLLNEYRIGVKKLSTTNVEGVDKIELFRTGYMYLFYAKEPMSNIRFSSFFKEAKNPLKGKFGSEDTRPKEQQRQYLTVTPQEQFMISTGKRYFKGYDDYDQVYRMVFDLETEGLDPKRHRIIQNGISTNRGFQKVLNVEGNTREELDLSELKCIDNMLRIIYTYKPDIITAHNGENFDWNFIIVRCDELGYPLEELSKKYFKGESIRKDDYESNLKLGGEIEKFHRTNVPYTIVTDSMHAVRRAQATDSNFLQHNLKYATKYLGMKKPNRVYTPGEQISDIWKDLEEHYAFNDEDGDWYLYDENEPDRDTEFRKGKEDDKPFKLYTRNKIYEGYRLVSGRYIIERYLLDDLWECDKVEWKLNTTNFLICKLLPVPYAKCTTMGTAGQWKALMMAWSYENGLAIPMADDTGKFTGGLSRLLMTGYVSNVVKLDYNSLYPSIILTWAISDENDLMDSMLKFLEYVLTTREKYKGLKKNAGKIVDKLKESVQNGTANADEIKEYEKAVADYEFNDKKQSQMKVFGNSFFGAYGSNSGAVYPWKSPKCAEQTTCIGRQSLRLMISHFSNLGYKPIVGDSVTPDTPLFIKYKNGMIDIKPISEVFNSNVSNTDELGREYDYTSKPYKILCRSGWVDVSYVYRHKTEKDIYRVYDDKAYVDVTKDHSLFTEDREEIKPTEISEDTKLETYMDTVEKTYNYSLADPYTLGKELALGKYNRVHILTLNGDNETMKEYYRGFIENYRDDIEYSKTCLAGLKYLKKMSE